MANSDLFQDRPVFSGFVFINGVWIILPENGLIGGDLHHIQIVDCGKFLFFRQSSTGHTAQFVIHPEIVLECDGRQSSVFGLDLNTFLGFNSLMKAFVIPSAEHKSPGEFVDNDNFSLFDDIIHIPFHDPIGLQRLVDVVT